MPDERPVVVHVHQEDGSRQWVVELRKLGGYLVVYRSAPAERRRAFDLAHCMGAFLGIPVEIVDPGKKVEDDHGQA